MRPVRIISNVPSNTTTQFNNIHPLLWIPQLICWTYPFIEDPSRKTSQRRRLSNRGRRRRRTTTSIGGSKSIKRLRQTFINAYDSHLEECSHLETTLVNIGVLLYSVKITNDFIKGLTSSLSLLLNNAESLLVPREALQKFKEVISSAAEAYIKNKVASTMPTVLSSVQSINGYGETSPPHSLIPIENETRLYYPSLETINTSSYDLESIILNRGHSFYGNTAVVSESVKRELDALSKANKSYKTNILRHLRSRKKLPLRWRKGLLDIGKEKISQINQTQNDLINRLRHHYNIIEVILFSLDSTTNNSLPDILRSKNLPQDVFNWIRDCFGATISNGVCNTADSISALQKIMSHKLPLPKWINLDSTPQTRGSSMKKTYPYLTTITYLQRRLKSNDVTDIAWKIFLESQQILTTSDDKRISSTQALAKALDTHLFKTKRLRPSRNLDSSSISSNLASSLISGDIITTTKYDDNDDKSSLSSSSSMPSSHRAKTLKNRPRSKSFQALLDTNPSIEQIIKTDPLLRKLVIDPSISDGLVTTSRTSNGLPPGFFNGIIPSHYPQITFVASD